MQGFATGPIEVFVVAPAMMCWGLERLVQGAQPAFALAGSAVTLEDALQALQRREVHVVALDLDGFGGLEAVERLQDRTAARLVVLTSSDDLDLLDRAVMAGVRGVLRKSDPPELLLKAIDKVQQGQLWLDRAAPGRIFMAMGRRHAAQANDPERLRIASLTVRERQTILAAASDVAAPGKVIADRLCISEHTLRNHLSSIYAKLGVANRRDLHAFAARHRLDRPEPGDHRLPPVSDRGLPAWASRVPTTERHPSPSRGV